jgi:hypothetical protein
MSLSQLLTAMGLGVVLDTPAGPVLISEAMIKYTSQEGMVSDADLSMESTTYGSDQTAKMQAILDLADGSTPLLVIVEGRYSISSPLKIKSNTYLVGVTRDCGFILRPNCNHSMLVNYNRSGSAQNDQNIMVANLTFNGMGWINNVAQQSSKMNADTSVGGYNWMWGFAGVKGLTVRDVTLRNGRSYAAYTTNCSNIVWENVLVEQNPDSTVGNLDGCDFVGSISNLYVKNLSGFTKDDLLGLATSYGWQTNHVMVNDGGVTIDAWYAYAACGDVVDVLVDGLTFLGGTQGYRIMSVDGTARMDRVTIRNIKGTITQAGNVLLADNFSTAGGDPTIIWAPSGVRTGNVGRLHIEDQCVKVETGAPIGSMVVAFKAEHVSFKNVQMYGHTASNNNAFTFGAAAQIGRLEIDGFVRNTAWDMAPDQIHFQSGCNIGTFILNNATYDKSEMTGLATDSALVKVSGNVGKIIASNVAMLKASPAIRYEAGTLGRVIASGVHMDAPFKASPAAGEGTGAFIECTPTLPKLVLSGYDGNKTHTGTVTTSRGDAFTL